MISVDINDDGKIDFLSIEKNYIRILNSQGEIVKSKKFDYDIGFNFVEDFNSDGYKEIAVSKSIGDKLYIWILNHNLEIIKEFVRKGKVYNGNSDSGINGKKILDLNRDGKREFITQVGTGYGWTPRGITVFDYNTAKQLWHFEIAPSVTEIDFDEDKNTGKKIILFGSYSPGNGYQANNGSDDLHSYIWLVDNNGNELLRVEVGDYFTGSNAKFVDMNKDGKNEILVYINTAYEFREKDNGNIYLLDYEGKVISKYSNDLSVRSVTVVPDYSSMKNNLLVTLRNGKLLLLDSNLKPIKQTFFENKSNNISMPYIKGILNTFYGEYVVVFYYEEDRKVKNPSTPLRRTSYIIIIFMLN